MKLSRAAKIGIFSILFSWIAQPSQATHLFRNSASNLNTGTIPDARVNCASVTCQGDLSNGLRFPDNSIQITAAGSSQWGTSGSDIRNINTGNVGVGTSGPSAKLDIRGSFISSGTTNLAAVLGNGNVGIGTLTNGSSLLDVFGGSITVRGNNAGINIVGGNLTVGTTSLIATVGGNVGIGTSNPSGSLEIQVPAGTSSNPILIISSGSTKLVEITPTSITLNIPLFTTQLSTVNEIWLFGHNGYGSGSTAIKRFSTLVRSTGTAMSYAGDNSVLGTTITINRPGLYAITYCEDSASGVVNFGVSVNSLELTTPLQSIGLGTRVLVAQTAGTNIPTCVSGTIPLFPGDIVRPHDDPTSAGTQSSGNYFRIVKVAP